MQAHAGHAHCRKEEEARGQQPAHKMIKEQHEELGDHPRSELAFPVRPASHPIGQLDDAYFAARGGNQIEQDLEAAPIEVTYHPIEKRPAHDEEPARRVGKAFAQGRAQSGRQAAQTHSFGSKLARAAARHVAARHCDVGFLPPRLREELRHQRLIVLEVRVDHRKIRRGARQHPLDARRSETAPADTLNAANAGIALRAFAHQVFGAVEGVVDHDDGFPVEPGECLLERVQQRRNVLALAERRNDDGKLRHAPAAFRDARGGPRRRSM